MVKGNLIKIFRRRQSSSYRFRGIFLAVCLANCCRLTIVWRPFENRNSQITSTDSWGVNISARISVQSMGIYLEDAIARTIQRISSWSDLRQFLQNAAAKNRLTPEIKLALDRRSVELSRGIVEQKTGLDLTNLSPAEEKIVKAASQYLSIKTSQGSHATRTMDQLRDHGLLGAAENSVCRGSPTDGFKTLTDANHGEVSYERIVVDHPDEFSARAVWYARRTLALPNSSASAPAPEDGDTQTRTMALLTWYKNSAAENEGVIPAFSNEDAAAAIGILNMQTHGRAFGNIQSRIDFACYKAGLPPLGLAADDPFGLAWSRQDRPWAFPVDAMRMAAQLRAWSDDDFDRAMREAERLPGQAHLIWNSAFALEAEAIKAWAYGFAHQVPSEQLSVEIESKRNARWSRDELILALDLYMKQRNAPLKKEADEITELSLVLNQFGVAIGQRNSGTYRNTNGVYMKLMNFRRFDPSYTADGKTGLKRGNKDEALVWEQFSGNLAGLAQVAHFIRSGIADTSAGIDISGPDETDIAEAEEGKVATRTHRFRERDRRLVEAAKAMALREHGRLFCVACDFDFSERYGDAGSGIIDVHHTKPVHTMLPGENTKVVDLVLLCANCHRVVHSKRRWLTVEQVKAALTVKSMQGESCN